MKHRKESLLVGVADYLRQLLAMDLPSFVVRLQFVNWRQYEFWPGVGLLFEFNVNYGEF